MPDYTEPPRTTGSYAQPTPTNPRVSQDFIPPHSARLFTEPGRGLENDPNASTGGSPGIYIERTRNRSPWVAQFGMDGSRDMLPFRIPFEHRSSFLSRWLGYNYVDGAQLKRVLPVVHPFWEFMRCRSFSQLQGVGWRGTAPIEPEDIGPAFDRPRYANYDQLHGFAVFETMPFQYKTDDQITEEYERNLWVRTEPGYESLYITGGSNDESSFKFDAAVGGDVGDKVAFPAGRNIPFPVSTIRATWYDVPLDFIRTDPDSFYYDNLLAGTGKLNDAEFLGFPANTLYADPPVVTIRPNPLPVDISPDVTYLCNVDFVWHHLEPTNLGTGVVTNLGHNMAVWRKDRKWYPVSINGAGVDRLFETFDYRLFFRRP